MASITDDDDDDDDDLEIPSPQTSPAVLPSADVIPTTADGKNYAGVRRLLKGMNQPLHGRDLDQELDATFRAWNSTKSPARHTLTNPHLRDVTRLIQRKERLRRTREVSPGNDDNDEELDERPPLEKPQSGIMQLIKRQLADERRRPSKDSG